MITSPQTRHLRDLGTAHYSQNCLISSKTFSKSRFDLQIRVNLRRKKMTDVYLMQFDGIESDCINFLVLWAPACLPMLHCDWLNDGKAKKNLKGLGFCLQGEKRTIFHKKATVSRQANRMNRNNAMGTIIFKETFLICTSTS